MSGPSREDRLLARLQDSAGEFVSGSELADLLAISRAAIGKRIANLRQKGWDIEGVHNRGYRLVAEADSLSPAVIATLLNTQWLGRVYFSHRRLDSTNEEAERLAHGGAPHGTVVLADKQSAGRGRLGRRWYSPAGENLYFSTVLRPGLEPSAAPPLSLAAAVGVAEGVRGFVGRPPQVKWPNDLLYGGRKFCGILLTMSADAGHVRHVIMGLGLNINTTSFPPELQAQATSLRLERKGSLQRALVLASVLNSLEPWIDRLLQNGSAPVIKAWLELADWMGQWITVNQPHGKVQGEALGLDERGALCLRRKDGSLEHIWAGDVEITS